VRHTTPLHPVPDAREWSTEWHTTHKTQVPTKNDVRVHVRTRFDVPDVSLTYPLGGANYEQATKGITMAGGVHRTTSLGTDTTAWKQEQLALPQRSESCKHDPKPDKGKRGPKLIMPTGRRHASLLITVPQTRPPNSPRIVSDTQTPHLREVDNGCRATGEKRPPQPKIKSPTPSLASWLTGPVEYNMKATDVSRVAGVSG